MFFNRDIPFYRRFMINNADLFTLNSMIDRFKTTGVFRKGKVYGVSEKDIKEHARINMYTFIRCEEIKGINFNDRQSTS